MTAGNPSANMSQRAVLQYLSLTDWKLANRLPIPAGEMMLSRLVQQIQGKDHDTVVRLTGAGLKAMRSSAIRRLVELGLKAKGNERLESPTVSPALSN